MIKSDEKIEIITNGYSQSMDEFMFFKTIHRYCNLLLNNEDKTEIDNVYKEILESDKELFCIRDKIHNTPLHYLSRCGNGSYELIKNILLSIENEEYKNRILRQRNVNGDTLLHSVCCSNNYPNNELVNFYLSLGCFETNVKNYMGINPLHYACLFGRKEVIELLRVSSLLDSVGNGMLHYALLSGDRETIEMCKNEEVIVNKYGENMAHYLYYYLVFFEGLQAIIPHDVVGLLKRKHLENPKRMEDLCMCLYDIWGDVLFCQQRHTDMKTPLHLLIEYNDDKIRESVIRWCVDMGMLEKCGNIQDIYGKKIMDYILNGGSSVGKTTKNKKKIKKTRKGKNRISF